jgi:predicted RNase H-like nuclease (RuvC/YqgF family)
MKKEMLEKEIQEKKKELESLEFELEKVKNCNHEWWEVELGGGELGFQCIKCLEIKD